MAPKTINQRRYLEAIDQHDIVFGIGPAGTGKTYLAMAQAVAFLVAKKVSRIILARPAVEAGEKLGFLPGDLQEKVNPYLRPLYDALYDMLDTERVARYLERGVIEIAPIAFMRGRTLNDSFVILDEAQNTTSEQMKMFLTRLGFGAKAVITGDITQIDLPAGRTSGLVEAMKVVEPHRGRVVHLLRRSGRRPPQAGPADRQGLRGVLERRTADALLMGPDGSGASHRALRVLVGDEHGRRMPSAPALARWLKHIAPARARGTLSVAVVSDARVRALNRAVPRRRQRDRRPEFPCEPPSHEPTSPCLWATSSSRGAWRGGRRARPATRSSPSGGCWPCTACCTCSATTTNATRDACGAWRRRLRRRGGLPGGLIERAGRRVIPLVVFLLACVAVVLGAIEAAFSALMRLSLRLAAERSDRPGALGAYLDDPLLLFVPVRFLLALVTAAATALLATGIGIEGTPHGLVRRRERGGVHRGVRAAAAARDRRRAIPKACWSCSCRSSRRWPTRSAR